MEQSEQAEVSYCRGYGLLIYLTQKFPWVRISSSEPEGGVSSNILPLKTIDNELIKVIIILTSI